MIVIFFLFCYTHRSSLKKNLVDLVHLNHHQTNRSIIQLPTFRISKKNIFFFLPKYNKTKLRMNEWIEKKYRINVSSNRKWWKQNWRLKWSKRHNHHHHCPSQISIDSFMCMFDWRRRRRRRRIKHNKQTANPSIYMNGK